jgi:hypothetical protein
MALPTRRRELLADGTRAAVIHPCDAGAARAVRQLAGQAPNFGIII